VLTRKDLADYVAKSKVFSANWHWFAWHFAIGRHPGDHPFAGAILDALADIEVAIPGFAFAMLNDLGSIGGKQKHEPHYEQLIQRLAEIHVIRRAVQYEWSFTPTFVWEPTPQTGGRKNPELRIDGGPQPILIEVKAPALLDHIRKRGTNPTQISSRSIPQPIIANLPGAADGVTFPRDNPIKDFLISADEKFAPFRLETPSPATVLVVVWDDFIYEPISALVAPSNGLFTANSFARDAVGIARTFPAVDGVILIRHMHQLIRATRDEPFIDACRAPFDFGVPTDFPPKAYVANPHSQGLPKEVVECFQAYAPSALLGAEYIPSDLIWWV